MAGAEAAAIAPVWEAIKGSLCFCCARADYFDELEADLRLLKTEVNRLKEKKEYVEGKVRGEKRPHMQQVYKVTDWLKTVTNSLEDADEIIRDGDEEVGKKAIRWLCPKQCCSYNRVGKRVGRKAEEVVQLIRDGDFDQVVEERCRDLVDEMYVPETLVGLDSKVEEICKYVRDTSVVIVGLYGIAGVGKTTLLKKVYNEIRSCTDHVLIWIDRSEKDPVQEVQKAIRKKFEIPEDFWKNKSYPDKEATWKFLRKEKFILMLDDIDSQWDYHLLREIGIPTDGNANESKIIFTTRPKEVCDKMRAQKSIKVEPLPPELAEKLFRLTVGQPTLDSHSRISKLANDATGACNGLPLVLVAFGRAMANNTNIRDWKRNVEKLKAQPTKIQELEEPVFRVLLKVSYDTLPNETCRRCFLYFPVFPESTHIKKEELIEFWIGEGFLDECKDVHDAREEGEEMISSLKLAGENIISSLKLASLLENGKSEEFVKMHALIYELALWLACEEGKKEDIVLAKENALEFSKWENAKRVSLWNRGIESLSSIPCNHLTTLLLRGTSLQHLPSEFFQSMHALTVLDLSDNSSLADLPMGIGELGNLQYLNLSGTCIENLPPEVQNLRKLRILIIGHLMNIERGVISHLVSLLVFRVLVGPTPLLSVTGYDENLLQELEALEHLNQLCILLCSTTAVHKLLKSHRLGRCIKHLRIVKLVDQSSTSLPKLCFNQMEHLEELVLQDCPFLTEVDIDGNLSRQKSLENLSHVTIYNCPIKNVTWLIHASNLQTLTLDSCCDIVVLLVGDDFRPDVFSNLKDLSLKNLSMLECICSVDLEFPALMSLLVDTCPNLKKLPFNINSAKNLKEIKGTKKWWNNLQWKNETLKCVLSSKLLQTKTKLVLKLPTCNIKSRNKALLTLVGITGVESASLLGHDKLEIAVIGKYFDPVIVVSKLRKIMPVEILSVGPVAEPQHRGKGG